MATINLDQSKAIAVTGATNVSKQSLPTFNLPLIPSLPSLPSISGLAIKAQGSIGGITAGVQSAIPGAVGQIQGNVGNLLGGLGSGLTVGGISLTVSLPTLAKKPATSGQPGGFPCLSFRISADGAQAITTLALVQVNTTTPATAAESAKSMTQSQKDVAAKGAGCGGRRARAEGIYSGSAPLPSSSIAYWNQKQATLASVGIVEKDTLPPPYVTVNDWKVADAGFMTTIEAVDAKRLANQQISQSLSL